MITNLKRIERRPGHHWMADGIQYLVGGGVMVLWGASMLFLYHLRPGWTAVVLWLVVPITLASGYWWQRALISRLKDRISVPRTGYVELRRPDKRFMVAVWAVTVVFALLITSMFAIELRREILAGGAHPRLHLEHGTGVGDSSWTGSGPSPDLRFVRDCNTFLFWTLIGCGLVVMTWGWVTLRRFLKDHPRIEGPLDTQEVDPAP